MSDSNSRDKVSPNTQEAPPVRRAYQTPVLRVFGEVRLLTGNGSGSGNDAMSAPGMAMASDLRCKDDVTRIGTHPLGFGLYLYRYRPGFGPALTSGSRCFGVLAQEVAAVVPSAVSKADNGYLQVDYSRIGVFPVWH